MGDKDPEGRLSDQGGMGLWLGSDLDAQVRGICQSTRYSDIQMNVKKLVTLNVRKSKMDQSALGVKRAIMCPWSLATRILADCTNQSDTAPLFPDQWGTQTPKVKMVKA